MGAECFFIVSVGCVLLLGGGFPLLRDQDLIDTISKLLLMAEILHQLIDSLSRYFQGFIHPKWLFGISAINGMMWLPCMDFMVLQALF